LLKDLSLPTNFSFDIGVVGSGWQMKGKTWTPEQEKQL
jgi:hypothetical protein